MLLSVTAILMVAMVTTAPVQRSVGSDETTLTEADFEAAKHIAPPTEEELEEEWKHVWQSGQFEGDIKVQQSLRGAATSYEPWFWPNAKVPYTISTEFTAKNRAQIAAAILEYQQQTCVDFVPRSNEDSYVKFMIGPGCQSAVGKTGTLQEISLGDGCAYKGVIMHEMMHAIGFFHEQSRSDRDDYVEILWDNIEEKKKGNFHKFDLNYIQLLDTKYDYDSVMHYGEYTFSIDEGNLKTIRRLQGTGPLGQRNGFSETDVVEINRLYKCPAATTPTPGTTTTTTSEHTTTQTATTSEGWHTTTETPATGCEHTSTDTGLNTSEAWTWTPSHGYTEHTETPTTGYEHTTSEPWTPSHGYTEGGWSTHWPW